MLRKFSPPAPAERRSARAGRRVRGIFAASAALAAACLAGCFTADSDIEYSASHPLLHVDSKGLMFRGEYVGCDEAVRRLVRNRIPRGAVIHILVDKDANSHNARLFQQFYLARAGYTRSVLVSERRTDVSVSGGE